MLFRRNSWQPIDATRDISIATNALAELERQSIEFEVKLGLWSAECHKIIKSLREHRFNLATPGSEFSEPCNFSMPNTHDDDEYDTTSMGSSSSTESLFQRLDGSDTRGSILSHRS